jgi:hypothetical protein
MISRMKSSRFPLRMFPNTPIKCYTMAASGNNQNSEGCQAACIKASEGELSPVFIQPVRKLRKQFVQALPIHKTSKASST